MGKHDACLPKYAKIEPHITPLVGHGGPWKATFFWIDIKPIQAQNRGSKREYVNRLFCPIAKIRLIWVSF